MAAFYVDQVDIATEPSDVNPQVLVEAFERDREVILRGGTNLFIGFAETEVDSDAKGWPLDSGVHRFKLPAGVDLWVAENLNSYSSIGVTVMVAPV